MQEAPLSGGRRGLPPGIRLWEELGVILGEKQSFRPAVPPCPLPGMGLRLPHVPSATLWRRCVGVGGSSLPWGPQSSGPSPA